MKESKTSPYDSSELKKYPYLCAKFSDSLGFLGEITLSI